MMRLRSLLFVPGDSTRKLLRARDSVADALILDLEDAVADARKGIARSTAAAFLQSAHPKSRPALFVRVNPLDTPHCLADLAAVVGPGLDGIVLPKANGIEDVTRLGHHLDALEARAGMAPGSVGILVVATETAAALLNVRGYRRAHARLLGLTWGAEDLSAALGASTNRREDGALADVYRLARAACLLGAAAAAVAPIDTLYADFRDAEGLERDCIASRRQGFAGRIAIHPAQVDTINRCYSPSDEDLAFARRVVDAFAAAPEAGTIGIDGRMYDRPHLTQARRVLAAAQA